MTKSATALFWYGLGDGSTDPSTGEPTLMVKVRALGVKTQGIFDYADQQSGINAIAKLPATELIFLVAISCGANRLPIVATNIRNRAIAGMYMIAPSIWCNSGCPAVPDNCPDTWVFNGPWYLSLPPGLSSYSPQRVAGSKQPAIKTGFSYTWHPCDSDTVNVQNPIIADIRKLIA